MTFQFLLLIYASTMIVGGENLWKRVTSKGNIPNDLQELLNALYLTGYMPEYILPEDDITETEKIEGEYLDFPDLKKAQDDIFVPPESEYSKNGIHLKNIKDHKRLVPDNSWNSKVLKEKLSPYEGYEETGLDFIAHLTENFTGKELGQTNSTSLDFLIPIPEMGTYSHVMPTQNKVTLYTFPAITGTNLKQNWPLKQNNFTLPPFVYTPKHNKSFTTAMPLQQFPQVLRTNKQWMPSAMERFRHIMGEKQIKEKINDIPINSTWAPLNHQTIIIGLQPRQQIAQVNKTFQTSGNMQQDFLRRLNTKPSRFRIEAKAVSQKAKTSSNGKIKSMAVKAIVPNSLYNNKSTNLQSKTINQINDSPETSENNDYKVHVIENNPHGKGNESEHKRNIFSIFNIFRKNKKQKHLTNQTNNDASIKSKRESSFKMLMELYEQLLEGNQLNENEEQDEQYRANEKMRTMIYNERKKK